MSEPGFWRDRVNGKWYMTDEHGQLFEVTFTGLLGMPATFMLLERSNPRAYEDYDERRTRRSEPAWSVTPPELDT